MARKSRRAYLSKVLEGGVWGSRTPESSPRGHHFSFGPFFLVWNACPDFLATYGWKLIFFVRISDPTFFGIGSELIFGIWNYYSYTHIDRYDQNLQDRCGANISNSASDHRICMIPYHLWFSMRRHKINRNSYFPKGGDDYICRITGISAGKWSLGELVSFLIILPVDNTVGRPSAIEIWTPLEWIIFFDWACRYEYGCKQKL